jgi:predicted RNA binding protein YcfA (HicA-like mRNA interferase family)
VKLPRDLSARELVLALEKTGYGLTRQRGSHATLTHPGPPAHSITVPMHDPLRAGTLNAILRDVASNLKLERSELLARLFG